ncbi:AfsR/SARP family transcriptional regulator [Nocardia neocaledoniensis]|uniref:DNA-binding SARP family transcriptional activator n=1 Tax=Nocardia neocaledoniensis TaxID=236511 RepID=A0A317N1U5_9NOCA|nr:BTAD domain-containing putative transcriptional regulator [Nocardia neocaledoniensis]PWV67920.1 DNA-binding SARP family transcriptional activator [Nocardia neocaledoniensis]
MLKFAVLGEIRAWRGGTELDLGSRQQRALLAALLLRTGRSATVDELIDDVWGENPTASAVGALRNHILHLRRVLEPERAAGAPPSVLVALGGGYALRVPAGCVDIEQVDELLAGLHSGDPGTAREVVDAALRHWTGTPLAGLPGPFADRQRAHLVDRRLLLLEQRAELDLRRGRYAEAVAELTPLCAEHPLRERPRGLLMTALYHSGRQAEALRVYAETRRDLVDQLGIEPGPELAELHRRILAGELAAPATSPRPRATQRVAQLPADVVDFTGRGDVVDLLAERLTAGGTGVPVCTIGGMGGIGKSALAVHVAHRVRDRFPDGQLHVDLHGFAADRTGGATAADTLGDFLRALGVPEGELAGGAAERAAQFRSRLDGKRVLVVLDNARSVDQIAPLIPGTPGSAVLVTSRSALPELPGNTAVRLDVLTDAEAHSLLAGIAGACRIAAEPEAVAAVLRACGGLPLAVRIVGARLAARPAWTVHTLAERLRDTEQRLSVLRTGELAVELAFRISYDQLDAGHARAFRMLAVPEVGEICTEGAAAILGVDVLDAEQVCEDLVDLNLLETAAPGRYTYHDLLRLFARELPATGQADPPLTALRRLLDFYLATVKHTVAVCNPGTRLPEHLRPTTAPGIRFADEHAAQAWLVEQRHNLVSLYRQCAQTGGPVLAPAADIAWATAELIDGGANCLEVARALEELLDAALRTGDRSVECRVRVALGALFAYSLGALRQGRDHQRIALSLDRGTISDARLTAFAAQLLSSSTRRGTETAAPLAHSARAIRLARRIGDRAIECACLVHEVKTLSDAGEYAAARERAITAKAMAAELGNRSLEVMATHELGVTLVYQGETAEGVRLCTEAVASARVGGIELRLGWALSRLAHVLLMAGRAPEAEPVVDEAIEVLTRAIGPLTRARVLVLQGLIKQAIGRPAAAEESFLAAAEAFESMQDPHLTHERLDAELEAPVMALLHDHLAALRARRDIIAAS